MCPKICLTIFVECCNARVRILIYWYKVTNWIQKNRNKYNKLAFLKEFQNVKILKQKIRRKIYKEIRLFISENCPRVASQKSFSTLTDQAMLWEAWTTSDFCTKQKSVLANKELPKPVMLLISLLKYRSSLNCHCFYKPLVYRMSYWQKLGRNYLAALKHTYTKV